MKNALLFRRLLFIFVQYHMIIFVFNNSHFSLKILINAKVNPYLTQDILLINSLRNNSPYSHNLICFSLFYQSKALPELSAIAAQSQAQQRTLLRIPLFVDGITLLDRLITYGSLKKLLELFLVLWMNWWHKGMTCNRRLILLNNNY